MTGKLASQLASFKRNRGAPATGTTGRVKSLHRRYIGLTHTFGAMLVAKHAQNGLSRISHALGDTYLLIGVKMKNLFSACQKTLVFTACCAVTHS